MTLQPLSPAQRARLTRLTTDDMLEAAGLQHVRRGRAALRAACWPAARHFADQVAVADWLVGQHGLAVGARWLLRRHVAGLLVAGQEHVPPSGPLLVCANHPGLADTLALFTALPRADLMIVATDRPFLRALPHVSRALINIGDGATGRHRALRLTLPPLRAGQALLTFPGGEIEPDPAIRPDAVEALAGWSESIGLLARQVQAVQIVPAIVSGVLSPRAQRHPLTRLRASRADRERLGAMLQIIVPAYRSVCVRVAFGPPLLGRDLAATHGDAAAISRAVAAAAARLIKQPPTDWRPVLP